MPPLPICPPRGGPVRGPGPPIHRGMVRRRCRRFREAGRQRRTSGAGGRGDSRSCRDSLNGSGIAVEPLREFEADYRTHRPTYRNSCPSSCRTCRMRWRSSTASDKKPLISSGDRSFTERAGRDPKAVDVPTITMTDLLDAERVERIDLLTMDIKLGSRRPSPALTSNASSRSSSVSKPMPRSARSSWIISPATATFCSAGTSGRIRTICISSRSLDDVRRRRSVRGPWKQEAIPSRTTPLA